MVKTISDVRVARDFMGVPATTTEAKELDFNLSTRQAIRIYGIAGSIFVASGVIVVTLETGSRGWFHSLHLEEGTLDTPNVAGGAADQFEDDSEIIYTQQMNMQSYGQTANGAGGLGIMMNPSGLVRFPEPILSPVNPSHRAFADEEEAGFELLIYYDYVELSDSELGQAFARRRR